MADIFGLLEMDFGALENITDEIVQQYLEHYRNRSNIDTIILE